MRKIIITIVLLQAIFVTPTVLAQEVMTLQHCIELGLENNYDVRISRNEAQVSKNNATIANAGMLPTLDLTGDYGGTLNSTEYTLRADDTKTKDNNIFDQTVNVGLSLNWTIFDGFKMQASYRQLKELERQGEINTRITIEDFMANLIAEYYNYIQQRIRLENFHYAMLLSKERLRIVEARYVIGSFSRLDLQQARVDFNADSSQYMKQQEVLYSSRIQLNRLMANKDMNRQLHIVDSAINVNTLLAFDELWHSTLETNAGLIKAGQNRTLADLDRKSVTARNYPYLKLNSGYGYTFNKYEIGTNKQRDNLGFNVGVTVGVNLFDGNRRRERRNANIAIENARLGYEQMEQALNADISNLWQAYLNNIQVLHLEKENLVAAKENHEIAMERYMLGDLSGIEMREAQKSLLDAEERILTAQYNTKLCEISLLQISGKITLYLE